jgi:hypothetical protein
MEGEGYRKRGTLPEPIGTSQGRVKEKENKENLIRSIPDYFHRCKVTKTSPFQGHHLVFLMEKM